MKIQKMSDDELENKIKELAQRDRELTVSVIEHLQEVANRRLFAKKGYSSLYDYCRKELKYSEGAAYRRVSCVKLIKDVPEAKAAIETGTLSLTSCAQVQSFCQKSQDKSIEFKKELVKKVENKSKTETESLLLSIDPQAQRQEKVRQVSDEAIEVRITISKELKAKLDKIKNLNSHKKLNPNYTELLEYLADEELKKLEKKTEVKQVKVTSPRCGTKSENPRYIPASVKRHVWKRDNCECQYIDSRTGNACKSKLLLEIHHKKAVALGGIGTIENLTLYCRAHNSFQAIQDLGVRKMATYFTGVPLRQNSSLTELQRKFKAR